MDMGWTDWFAWILIMLCFTSASAVVMGGLWLVKSWTTPSPSTWRTMNIATYVILFLAAPVWAKLLTLLFNKLVIPHAQ